MDAVLFGQDVSQVMVVEVRVAGAGQGEHLLADLRWDSAVGRAAAAAVGKSCRSVAAEGPQETSHLPQRKLKLGGSLASAPTPGQDFGNHVQALLLSNGQSHLLAHEVTFSLNR